MDDEIGEIFDLGDYANSQLNITMSMTMAPISAGQIRCLMENKFSEDVGTPAMAHVDREITPLIAELATLGPGNNKHPTAKQLFKWLAEPNCSAEEFTYVIGPLEDHVSGIMMSHFKPYVSISFRRGCKLVGKIAAEALAKRCSVLEGPWETAGWFVVNLNKTYYDYFSNVNHGFASKQLSKWIIHTIGDPERCPRSYLRIELIHLLIMMVRMNENNQNQALNSIISAFSSLNMDYFIGGIESRFFNMNFETIIDTLDLFASQNFSQCLIDFDHKVAQELRNILKIRLSIMLKDVAYNHSVIPRGYSEPCELKALTALLKTVNGRINLEWERFQDAGIHDSQRASLESLSRAVGTLITGFKYSFQTPQLNEVTALCVIDLLELVLLSNVALWNDQRELYHRSLSNTNVLLKQLLDFCYSVYSPFSLLGNKVISYDKRLKILKKKCQGVSYVLLDDFPRYYPMITVLFFQCIE